MSSVTLEDLAVLLNEQINAWELTIRGQPRVGTAKQNGETASVDRKCGLCLCLKGVEQVVLEGLKPANFEESGTTRVTIRPRFCPACGREIG